MTVLQLRNLQKKASSNLASVSKSGAILAAAKGQPFSAIFGRDALVTFIILAEAHKISPNSKFLSTIKKNLLTLAQNQGQKVDNQTDEEPGKIEHENRSGIFNQQRLLELQKNNWPVKKDQNRQLYLRYWGSIDSTPLFIVAIVEYLKISSDWDFFYNIEGNFKKALLWLEDYGDVDDDSFIEYKSKNRSALINQGWKDSNNSVLTETGQHPKEPIALVEIQGYTYWAFKNAAWVYEHIGNHKLADHLLRMALRLRGKFNQKFWMKDKKFFAHALDGDKKQIKDIVSNAGHLLITGILDRERAEKIVQRLMLADMLTPYGIRTLSSKSPHFKFDKLDLGIQDEAYHNGTVWPFDNAIIAMGMKKYGFNGEAKLIIEGNLRAVQKLGDTELFQVSPEGELVRFIKASNPQTWTSASTLLWTLTLYELERVSRDKRPFMIDKMMAAIRAVPKF